MECPITKSLHSCPGVAGADHGFESHPKSVFTDAALVAT